MLSRSLSLLSLSLVLLCACSRQGVGERCDTLNANSDCELGLVCIKADKLALVEVGAICCPAPGAATTALECQAGGDDGGSGIAPPSETDAGDLPADTGAPSDASSAPDSSIPDDAANSAADASADAG